MDDDIRLIHGEMLETMRGLEAQSLDAIITDLPYGTTACKWDNVIPFAPMWEAVKHALKPHGAFVTTASQPFTSALVMSNPGWFRYEWIWAKTKATGFLDANRKPLKAHENIVVFSANGCIYNPQMVNGSFHRRGGKNSGRVYEQMHGAFRDFVTHDNKYYPQSIINIGHPVEVDHPTQKPIGLIEYLIRTYTNPGDLVGDFCFGSGTTAVACVNTGRRFVGCEKEAEYHQIAVERVRKARLQMRMEI